MMIQSSSMQGRCFKSHGGKIQRTETACPLLAQFDTNAAAVLSARTFIKKRSQIEEKKIPSPSASRTAS